MRSSGREVANEKTQKTHTSFSLPAYHRLLITFCSRRRSLSGEGIREAASRTSVHGVNPFIPSYCVTEEGILFVYGGNIRYMDLNDRQEYVVCNRVNCTHLTPSCSSFYAGILDEPEGVALYQGYIYRFQKNESANAMELIRTDTFGGDKKVIVSLDIGNYDNDSWMLSSVGNVNYSDGMLWAEVRYKYITENGETIDHKHCIGVDLAKEELFEVTPREAEESSWYIVGIKQGTLLLRKDWIDGTKDPNASEAHRETWMRYDVGKRKLTTLMETTKKEMPGDNGENWGWLTRYIILGEYQGEFLLFEKENEKEDTEQNVALQIWNLEDNQIRDICTLEKSVLLRLNEDMRHDVVVDGEFLFSYHYINEDTEKEVRRLRLSTGEVETLFTVPADWDYRITEETSDDKSFLLKRYIDVDEELYLISKEDFYSGNLEDMELLRVFEDVYL